MEQRIFFVLQLETTYLNQTLDRAFFPPQIYSPLNCPTGVLLQHGFRWRERKKVVLVIIISL